MDIFEILTQITTLNFCYFSNSRKMNVRLLQTEYYEYKNIFYEIQKKYPSWTNHYWTDEIVLTEEAKEDIKKYSAIQVKVRDRFIKNVQMYCKNYPNEEISKNRFLKEYEEYPYRLHQNMNTLIEDLL